jgi:DNA-binding transcriptional regulator YiaG
MTPDEIRNRRDRLGLTQAELAAVLGVHRDTVGGWETGAISLTAPRSLWLDMEMAKLRRKPGRPRRRRQPSYEEGT